MYRKCKKPLYSVIISEREEPKIEPVKQKVIVDIKPMSIEKLIGGYKNEEEE